MNILLLRPIVVNVTKHQIWLVFIIISSFFPKCLGFNLEQSPKVENSMEEKMASLLEETHTFAERHFPCFFFRQVPTGATKIHLSLPQFP